METRNPKELTPHPVHAGIYQVGDTRALELDIIENGLKHPIEIISEGQIIAGRRRNIACINIGMTEVPVTVFDLPEDKLLNHMLSDNLYRVKTWDEVYNEIAHKRKEVGKRQGERTDQTEEQKKINTRRQVADELGLKENVVRVLELIGDKPQHREILERDTQNNTINALEETYKKRLSTSEEQYDDEFPVVDLRPKRCVTCGGVPPRIISDYVNNTLSYQSDKDHCNYM